MDTLNNRTVFITGASRGIGRAIAIACARQGANVVVAAKSDTPHPKLPGTIHSVAEEIQAAGGNALPLVLDVRDEKQVRQRMDEAADQFGGIDALVNNAGAIRLTGVENLKISRYDLMHQVNARAVFNCSQAALPYLKDSEQAHILSLSPPLNLDKKWFAQYGPYTTTKYAMTMLSIGMAEEFRRYGIAVNTLWPKTLIATSAIEFEAGGPQMMAHGRKPEIMADAAVSILGKSASELSGENLIDEDVLRAEGIDDFEHYRYEQGEKSLMPDLFLE
ncbi:MAG: NAD(P)-dependent oxidoreductase [Gammaproteobacteria bacterium]|uniref:Short-chain dehydrogenase/reductase SDR n=1 Tax=Marinobacter nitratireducens TaxID=1137280 RepID=A0A072NEG8_9GAMM|nr:NAD(P)-dependent oxidoreductase [Marinobacter nitratireducens]KEF31495.1 short-chain dehydrogenase/reductase SDR [Marinobacter nitratireducens]TNE77041.1 MAG: NAD(P)-dependent oxidoreductase [Gammaproteobacteria bacterium]